MKKFIVAVLVIMVFAVPAFAIFGFGDKKTVSDLNTVDKMIYDLANEIYTSRSIKVSKRLAAAKAVSMICSEHSCQYRIDKIKLIESLL